MAERFGEQAGREKHRSLGEGMRENLHQSGTPADRTPGLRSSSKREHEKEVADLGHSRIGDQQLQPRLSQGNYTACDDRRRAKATENDGCLVRGKGGKHVKPQPKREKE